jgi:hypothetical protein
MKDISYKGDKPRQGKWVSRGFILCRGYPLWSCSCSSVWHQICGKRTFVVSFLLLDHLNDLPDRA